MKKPKLKIIVALMSLGLWIGLTLVFHIESAGAAPPRIGRLGFGDWEKTIECGVTSIVCRSSYEYWSRDTACTKSSEKETESTEGNSEMGSMTCRGTTKHECVYDKETCKCNCTTTTTTDSCGECT